MLGQQKVTKTESISVANVAMFFSVNMGIPGGAVIIQFKVTSGWSWCVVTRCVHVLIVMLYISKCHILTRVGLKCVFIM